MWILILTLAFGTGGAEIHSVEFSHQSLCNNAAKAYVRQRAISDKFYTKSAICVKNVL